AAYEFIEGLRFGAAWRVTMVAARFALIQQLSATSQSNIDRNDLSATRYNGLRAGLQYSPRDAQWGVGVNWRSPISFIVRDGTITGQSMLAGTVGTITGTNPTIAAEFPQQWSLGGFFEPLP